MSNDDIVKRLQDLIDLPEATLNKDLHDAISEIEKLRSGLRGFCHIVSNRRLTSPDQEAGHDLDYCYDVAMKVLGDDNFSGDTDE